MIMLQIVIALEEWSLGSAKCITMLSEIDSEVDQHRPQIIAFLTKVKAKEDVWHDFCSKVYKTATGVVSFSGVSKHRNLLGKDWDLE